jgi:ATP-dependent Clp protease adaptor protein ClpS
MSNTELDVQIDEKIKKKIVEPKLYKVIFLNDDYTPMEFVVSLIITLFKHSEETAHSITMRIHEEGSGVVGIYSFELAEQKSLEATVLSRDNGFPLRVKIEEET